MFWIVLPIVSLSGVVLLPADSSPVMSAPDAPRDFCFICGHQREGHDDYNRKGDGSVDHPFVEPPTGNVFQRCGHCGPSLYDCPPCKSSAGMRAKMQDVRRKDAPREPVGRDDDLEAIEARASKGSYFSHDPESYRLNREVEELCREVRSLREAARELLEAAKVGREVSQKAVDQYLRGEAWEGTLAPYTERTNAARKALEALVGRQP